MKPNFFDRAIAAVAPRHALSRAKARAQLEVLRGLGDLQGPQALAGDWTGGGVPPVQGRWVTAPRDARSDTLRFLPLQRAQSRELARTSPIAVGAINTNVDRVVGTGLALSAMPNRYVLGWTVEQAREWKKLVQREFSLWSDSTESDQCQELNFYDQQALILRSVLESGDTFTLLPDGTRTKTQPYALRVQVLEADRVGNPGGKGDLPNMAGGVRKDAAGAPEAYHIYRQHPGSYLPGNGPQFAGDWVERIGGSGRRRVLHHFRKLRPDLPRGVPYLAPIVECIKQISRYTEAEIMAAVISAYFTVFIEAPGGNVAPVFGHGPDASPDQELNLGAGAVLGLAPGEKATFANPSRPNPNFEPFLLAVIKQMGMALGLPFELLVKQFNSSYSASKAALMDAWIYFRSVRTWLSRSFCQPVYETWLAEAVAIGRIPAAGFFSDPLIRWAYSRAAWHGDSMGSINPKDEIAAFVEAVEARLMTRERAQWELFGDDFNETLDQKSVEEQMLDEAGLTPKARPGAAPAAGGTTTTPPARSAPTEDQP